MKNDFQLINEIRSLQKAIFSVADLGKILSVKEKSLRTVIMRLKNKGVLNQVKRGWYSVFDQVMVPEEVVGQLYYPSYLSLKTVLHKIGIINQIPRQIYAVSTKKSYKTAISGVPIIYRQIKPDLFFGYYLDNQVLTAYPEKALLDLLYYVKKGRETVSFSELDLSQLNLKRWRQFKKPYSKIIKELIEKIEKNI